MRPSLIVNAPTAECSAVGALVSDYPHHPVCKTGPQATLNGPEDGPCPVRGVSGGFGLSPARSEAPRASCVVRGRGPPGRRRRNNANAHQETFSTAGSHPRVDALVGERATCAAPSSSPMDTEHMPRPVFSTAIARSSVGLRLPVTQPWAVQSALPLPHASAPPAQSDQRTTRPGWRASAVADRAGRAPSQSAAR